jgi:SAM-dependent methyltransferase
VTPRFGHNRRLALQHEVWTSLGRTDPDWAVLTAPERRAGGWGEDLEAFYGSGREAVEACLALASLAAYDRALDYGCGTGRLSIALAARFSRVTAVDISPAMLEVLVDRAAARGFTNISTATPRDMPTHEDHDFAISLLVLQHIESRRGIGRAIAEIAGSLRSGGVAVIELAARPRTIRARVQPKLRVYRTLRAFGVSAAALHRAGFSGICMTTMPDRRARKAFEREGLEVTGRVSQHDAGHHYTRWILRKAP